MNISKLAVRHGDPASYIAAIRRDQFQCVKCGDASEPALHHIDGQGVGLPKEERNNSPDNLVTLCNNCHLELHAITAKALYARHRDTVLEQYAAFVGK